MNIVANLSLRDTILSRKLVLIPAIFIVATMPLFFLACGTIGKQQTTLESVVFVDFGKQEVLERLNHAAERAAAAVYQAAALSNGGAGSDKIGSLMADCRASLTEMMALVDQADHLFAGDGGGAGVTDERARIQAVGNAARAYRSAIVDVLDMLDADPATALAMLGPVEQQSQILFQHLDKFESLQRSQMDRLRQSGHERVWRILTILVVAGLLVYCLSVVLSLAMSRHIAGGIGRVTAVMRRLAEGDKDIDATVEAEERRKDEVGEMFRALRVFKDGLDMADRLSEVQDRASREQAERAEAMERMVGWFRETVAGVLTRVERICGDLGATAQRLVQDVDVTKTQVSRVNSAADHAAGNVEAVAVAARQLSSAITLIADRVDESARLLGGTVDRADRTNELFSRLSDAAERIGEVIQLISGIAKQTNLLALNATIEATRAGQAGRGFAVVASEVKSLAGQTAQASEEITRQISAVQDAIRQAVSATGGIVTRITEINGLGAEVAATVAQQRQATSEIAGHVEDAADRTRDVSHHIEGVVGAAAGTERAADEILGVSRSLGEQAAALQTVIQEFLGKVQAA